jgi:hypothetical protein
VGNRKAVDATIKAMRKDGRLKAADAATVQMVESLADAVDIDPANASLWREFRASLDSLMRLGLEEKNDGDEIALIIAALRGPAEVSDSSESKPAKPRARSRKVG